MDLPGTTAETQFTVHNTFVDRQGLVYYHQKKDTWVRLVPMPTRWLPCDAPMPGTVVPMPHAPFYRALLSAAEDIKRSVAEIDADEAREEGLTC